MNAWIPAAALIAIGSVQMMGDVIGRPDIRAAGAATHASPAPKVFTAQSGFETFSSRFFIESTDARGARQALELTPRVYRNVKGPYNRRNAYGAALSYGPVLASNPHTRPMLDSVMRYAFCGEAPLLGELGLAREQATYPIGVRLEPRQASSRTLQFKTEFAIRCD
jgi:hypothetical protein